MIIADTVFELRATIAEAKKDGKIIGFVPTMGALHEGHLSLIRIAKKNSDFVVVSIFVNPTQFNDKTDLKKYPRMLDADLEKCREVGVDLVFAPDETQIYPPKNDSSRVSVLPGKRAQGLCGATRPGFFEGVVTVVSILFNQVQPDIAVFGEKDYQQALVIKELVQDLHFPITIITGPIIRDDDGLALSSRNMRLSPELRQKALNIVRVLKASVVKAKEGEHDTFKLCQEAANELSSNGLHVDYVEIREAEELTPVAKIEKNAQMLIAAFAGEIRLIDNIRIPYH